jgi:hypothetical protein
MIRVHKTNTILRCTAYPEFLATGFTVTVHYHLSYCNKNVKKQNPLLGLHMYVTTLAEKGLIVRFLEHVNNNWEADSGYGGGGTIDHSTSETIDHSTTFQT